MSYIVRQKIKGNIYLYRVESYWDKEKGQARQRRVYIGPEEKKNKVLLRKPKGDDLVSRYYGNMFLLNEVAETTGLRSLLQEFFPDVYREILALAFYEVSEQQPMYLYEYWQEENLLKNVKKMDSAKISAICGDIGKWEKQRYGFISKWIEQSQPIKAVYYDITSISSYSTNIKYIEWGYNRDGESLPQLNMGIVCNQSNGLPLIYNTYPGSVVDVTTLRNCLKFLKSFGINNVLFVMDRGFFSTSNVTEMNKSENNISFIQPLPLSLKVIKELIKHNRKRITDPTRAFQYDEEIIYHQPCQVNLGNNNYSGHIYFNEKAYLDQKHHFLLSLFAIEEKHKDAIFLSEIEWEQYQSNHIAKKYQPYFKWNKKTGKIIKDMKAINDHLAQSGCYVIITNKTDLDKNGLLMYYRNKDRVEKLFDMVKNEMDGMRLRAHNDYTNDGRLFIKFIALTLYSHISHVMQEKDLFKMYSLKELLSELKKIKLIQLYNAIPFVTELTKKHRKIFEAFNIPPNKIHSY